MASQDPNALVEFLKVSAGPIALAWNVLSAGWSWHRRQQRKAIGAAPQQIREALERARRIFQDVSVSPRSATWFIEENDRREAEQTVRDQRSRCADRELREQLERVADQLRLVFTWASASLNDQAEGGFWQKAATELQRQQHQFDQAQLGEAAVDEALARLSALEVKAA